MPTVWNVFKTAVRYHAIKGALVIKVISMVLPFTGYAPWTADQTQAVSDAVDAVVGALSLFAVFQAHNNDPNTSNAPTKE